MRVKIRKLRHWKQRWDKNAQFVWSRRTVYAGVTYLPGDDLPSQLEDNKTKLRRFWESARIELAEFEAPNVATGQKGSETTVPDTGTLPEGVTVEKGKGSWFVVTVRDDQVKVNGQKALDRLLGDLRVEADVIEADGTTDDDAVAEIDETEAEVDAEADVDADADDDDGWLDGKTESE